MAQALLLVQQGFGGFESRVVALLLIAGTQFEIQPGFFAAEFFDCGFGLFLKAGFASIDMIEAARDLAGEFDMRHLVFTDRHLGGAVDQDIRALQQRITEKAVSAQVFFRELFLLILVGRHALQPAQRGDHRQQQMQLGVFRHSGLNEQRGACRIDAGSQPVHHHVPHILLDDLRRVVMRGQRVPVRHEEQAFVFVLHLHPIFQHTVVMAQVQTSGWAHTR